MPLPPDSRNQLQPQSTQDAPNSLNPQGTQTPERYPFFAILSRMKYIDRWSLMRNARPESLAEHTLDVALIAHALATLANEHYQTTYGNLVSAEHVACLALFHDAPEIITGDLPTPVKYANPEIQTAYKTVEADAKSRLLESLPEDLQASYQPFFSAEPSEEPMSPAQQIQSHEAALVHAADKLSALIKCVEEARSGNSEFLDAEKSCRDAVFTLAKRLPEVAEFVQLYLPAYGDTLDKLLRRER